VPLLDDGLDHEVLLVWAPTPGWARRHRTEAHLASQMNSRGQHRYALRRFGGTFDPATRGASRMFHTTRTDHDVRARRFTTRRPGAVALLLTAAIVLAACGDSASDDAKTTTTAATTTTAPVSSAPAGEQADGDPVPSSGCGQASTSAEPVTVQKEYLDDSDRWFLLTTPPDVTADDPVPLVLDFHGLAEGAEIHSQVSNFGPFAQEHGFIVVQPQGEGSPVRWIVEPSLETNTDLQYTSDLLDQLEAEHCIDTSRIYATGLSNGAFMSSVLGCTMADRIAAIAPVAGLIRPSACDPSRPVPVLTFHGTEDPILLFNGGVGNRLNNILSGSKEEEPPLPEPDLDGPGYPTAAQDWAEGNGCSGDGTDSELTETVTARVWDCPADGPVEFLIIDGGGHSWPGSSMSLGGDKIVGRTDKTIDADELIWAFFQRFQLPAS
jgi:polyhydroxybutyrate depolymerase